MLVRSGRSGPYDEAQMAAAAFLARYSGETLDTKETALGNQQCKLVRDRIVACRVIDPDWNHLEGRRVPINFREERQNHAWPADTNPCL
jgi:hypothetical protein